MVQYIFTPWRNRHELLAVRAQFYPEHHHHNSTNALQPQRIQPEPQTNPRSQPWSQHQIRSQTQTQSHPSNTTTITTAAAAAAAKQQAVARVSMWMHRGGCPHMVESTALLMAAMLSDEGYGDGNGNGNGNGSGGSGAAAASRAYAVRAAYSAAFSRFVTGLLDSHQDKQRKMSMYDVAKSVGLPATFVELRHQATHEQLPSLPRLRAAAASALQWIWDYYWRGLAPPVTLSSRSAALLARLPPPGLGLASPAAGGGGAYVPGSERVAQPAQFETRRAGLSSPPERLQQARVAGGQGGSIAAEGGGEEKELEVLLGRYLGGGEEEVKGEIARFSEGLVLTVLDSISGSTRDSTVMRRAVALQRDILLNAGGADRMEEDEVPEGEAPSKGLGDDEDEVDKARDEMEVEEVGEEDEEDEEKEKEEAEDGNDEDEVAIVEVQPAWVLYQEESWVPKPIGVSMSAFTAARRLFQPRYRFNSLTASPATVRTMHIQTIPMWTGKSDNYAYLVVDDKSKEAVIIDPAHPAEVAPVLKKAIQNGAIKLSAIINTHHHWDHAGGNEELLSELGQPLEIIGGKDCKKVTKTPAHGTTFNIGDIVVKALHTPCHTQDSICFFMQDGDDKVVFTGDTLFHGGEWLPCCGRFFEGNGEEMHKALNVTLGSLPDDTRVFPGHEYTGANAKFGVSVLPSGPVKALESFAKDNKETQGKFTIGDEKKHNVFMRPQDPEIQKATGETDPIAIMTKLREMKNNFKEDQSGSTRSMPLTHSEGPSHAASNSYTSMLKCLHEPMPPEPDRIQAQ
ncbi:Las1-like-domain-containing protein [Chaetomium sp. MPI-CAGE-AT-0009]|nr:Las1-like-domain-containing protein [Chaetomium sp. MPI-CAGE-AT-0009]